MPILIWILVFGFIGLILFILLIPIRLHINTDQGKSFAGVPGLLWIEVKRDEEDEVAVLFWILFFRYYIYPSAKKEKKKETAKNGSPKKKVFSMPKWSRAMFLIRTFWQYIRKSRLKKLYLNMDTRDVIVNSLLFPVFATLNTRPAVDLNVNYTGRFSLVLDVRNNLLTLIVTIIKNLINR